VGKWNTHKEVPKRKDEVSTEDWMGKVQDEDAKEAACVPIMKHHELLYYKLLNFCGCHSPWSCSFRNALKEIEVLSGLFLLP